MSQEEDVQKRRRNNRIYQRKHRQQVETHIQRLLEYIETTQTESAELKEQVASLNLRVSSLHVKQKRMQQIVDELYPLIMDDEVPLERRRQTFNEFISFSSSNKNKNC